MEKDVKKFSDTATSQLLNTAVDIQNQAWRIQDATKDVASIDQNSFAIQKQQEEQLRQQLLLFELTDRLARTTVTGPPMKEITELQDVEYDLDVLRRKAIELEGMAVGLDQGGLNQLVNELGSVLGQIDVLEEKQRKLNSTIKAASELNPYEKMQKRAKELGEELAKVANADVPPSLEFFGIQHPMRSTVGEIAGNSISAGEMMDDIVALNKEMDQYFDVWKRAEMQHERMAKIRGEWFDTEKVEEAAQDLREIIADNELLAKTIGMTSREQEIFIAQTQGVSQGLIDQAKAMDDILTKKEEEIKKTKDLKDAAEQLKKDLREPLDVYMDGLKELDKMLDKGFITDKQHALGKERAEKEMMSKDASDAVTGIQTALGTFKVASGADSSQKQQLSTQKEQLKQQKSTVKVLTKINKNLTSGNAFT